MAEHHIIHVMHISFRDLLYIYLWLPKNTQYWAQKVNSSCTGRILFEWFLVEWKMSDSNSVGFIQYSNSDYGGINDSESLANNSTWNSLSIVALNDGGNYKNMVIREVPTNFIFNPSFFPTEFQINIHHWLHLNWALFIGNGTNKLRWFLNCIQSVI